MAHAPEIGAINPLHFFCHHQFLVRVSCKSWTRAGWYQIPAPIRTLFNSKPESGVHETEMIIHDVFRFNLPLATIPAIIIAAASVNSSSTSLSATFIFGAINFHSRRIWYKKLATKTWRHKMESIYGAGFCSMCHSFYNTMIDEKLADVTSWSHPSLSAANR